MIGYLFGTSLAYVGLKAFQQLNVAGGHYLPVIPVSFGMAFCEAFTIYTVAQGFHWANVAAIGAGAAVGCILAMYLHGRLFKRGRV